MWTAWLVFRERWIAHEVSREMWCKCGVFTVCCSVLQCVAVCCSVLLGRCAAVQCNDVQCVAVCCSVLQYVTVFCSKSVVQFSVLQCVSVCISVRVYIYMRSISGHSSWAVHCPGIGCCQHTRTLHDAHAHCNTQARYTVQRTSLNMMPNRPLLHKDTLQHTTHFLLPHTPTHLLPLNP